MRPDNDYAKLSRQVDLLSLSDDELSTRGYNRSFLITEIKQQISNIFYDSIDTNPTLQHIFHQLAYEQFMNKIGKNGQAVIDIITEFADAKYSRNNIPSKSYLNYYCEINNMIMNILNNNDDDYNEHLYEQLIYFTKKLKEHHKQTTQKKDNQKSLVSGCGQINENPSNNHSEIHTDFSQEELQQVWERFNRSIPDDSPIWETRTVEWTSR